ncbi:hypothetical protein [Pseudomonas syringae]|uniref:hypothetical protein n=1 Tax=Pseudomonas syringae TaxID=317 RepID=UPI0004644BBC|nr:hypothetical protein [Pseudomonas syringae]AZG84295.1 hypothetical protein N032_00590 [Pseudomonas syringae pv. pisi str. PP1]KMY01675.1 hypothetical protein V476_11190 [Pseudomonas syringae KCTC 12500]POP80511.1 hypothetical protein CXB38_16400 [Pseudomonas syringae]POR84822.1 hypothetical protein BKM21_15755 [Pseudomonas syringae pv. syringae]UZS62723.1 hypothetical protein OQB64_00530 [Pseudomonas syringae]
MTLSKGDIIKLIDVDQAKVVLSDWLNSREAAPGDIAEVEEISMGEAGCIARLLCESHAGSLEWRASYFEAGLTYEVLRSYPNDVPS